MDAEYIAELRTRARPKYWTYPEEAAGLAWRMMSAARCRDDCLYKRVEGEKRPVHDKEGLAKLVASGALDGAGMNLQHDVCTSFPRVPGPNFKITAYGDGGCQLTLKGELWEFYALARHGAARLEWRLDYKDKETGEKQTVYYFGPKPCADCGLPKEA